MNWLAHFLLAAPSPAFRVGSVLPDFSPAAVLATLPPAFQPGIAQHQQVDLFTDAHPVVRSGMRRFPPPFRRFGGILTDVFYDHFLTRNWADHTPVPLPAFAAQVYAAIEVCRTDLPPEIYARLARLREANLLNTYGELPGIARVLKGIGARLRRPFDLAAAVPILEEQYEALQADFNRFFPELRAHVEAPPSGDS